MKYIDDTPELGDFTKKYPSKSATQAQLNCKKGIIIEIEGIDGSGKSTQAQLLSQNLTKKWFCSKINFIHSDFMRVPLLKAKWKNVDSYTFYYLYMMGLSYTYFNVVVPRLSNNEIVVLDRYLGTINMKGQDILKPINEINLKLFRKPDISILIDIDPQVALERKKENGHLSYWECGGNYLKEYDLRNEYNLNRYSQGFIKYQTKRRNYLLNNAKTKNSLVVNGEESISKVQSRILQYCLKNVEKKYESR